MAPRGPAKARDYDYSNVGKAGRRTGITLAEGKRDEHGMEEIEGMFSSPEKSPANGNWLDDVEDETTMGSDGMSLDEGNAPGPVDFLNGGRASYFPPPVARSPLKTGLTGSPRRTPGLSPQRIQPLSSPSDGKGLNSVRGDLRRDASPLSNRSVNAQSSNLANGLQKSKGNTKVPEPAPSVNFSDSDEESQVNGDENADSFGQLQPDYDADDFAGGDDTVISDQAEQLDEPDSNAANPDGVSTKSPEPPRKAEQPQATSKAKAPASRNINRVEETTHQNGIEEQEPAPAPAPKAKRPGRPPKAQRKASEDTEEQRPSKKPKTSAGQARREVEATGDPEIDNIVEDYANRKGGSKARSLHVLKREKPADSATTRSGRRVVKPLAYWKNEKCLYGDEGISEGKWIPCSTMTGVLRAEESDSEYKKSKKGKGRPSKKSKAKGAESDEEEEEGEEVDAWEQEGGVLHGYIRKWDTEVQAGVDEEEVLDIAYAPSGIETKDVKDSTFRFAKLLSSPFLGSGIVELPPGGVKRPKNSKKMHMVFYVCQGRVQIDISGVQFSAGKGCVFQVPRGNYYSFANAHERNVRLFFTQGCVPENESPAPDDLKQTHLPLEGDSAAETGQPGPRAKGRPKGSKTKDKGPKQKGGTKS